MESIDFINGFIHFDLIRVGVCILIFYFILKNIY